MMQAFVSQSNVLEVSFTGAANGHIGPNAIVQTVIALRESLGAERTARMLVAHGQRRWVAQLPTEPVPEPAFVALVRAVVDELGPEGAEAILRRSGRRTADYVLENRLPRPVQALLRAVRGRLGARLLLWAISKNAATFGESGTFSYRMAPEMRVTVANPVLFAEARTQAAMCAYQRAALERLFRALIDERARLVSRRCQALGAQFCEYTIERPLVENV